MVSALCAEAREDHHLLDRLRAFERAVDGRLERHDVAAAQRAVLREHDLGAAIVDAIAQRFGGEAAEDDGVRRADARARQHADHDLGHHAHVDRDAIALLDAEAAQHGGERDHLLVQLARRSR